MKYLLVLFTCVVFCRNSSAQPNTFAPASISFKTDSRVEVLYYVFLMAGYPLVSPHATLYKSEAKKYFSPYKNHNAVLLASRLIEKGFVADYAINWLFKHSAFPSFHNTQTINFPFQARPINADTLELFRKELVNFYRDARCADFLISQQAVLDNMVAGITNSFDTKNVIHEIEDYFGVKYEAKFFVILSPLLHSGGFTVERTDTREIFAMVGPGSVKDSLPQFDKTYLEQDLIIHEFSHNYANPITEQFIAESKKLEPVIFPAIKKAVKEEGYGSWESYMLEVITRATTIRIVEKIYGKAAADDLAEYEAGTGFKHAVDIADELKKYEAQREKYPTLKEFFPVILKRMEQLGKAEK